MTSKKRMMVREPVQVWLASDDSSLLARLSADLDLPKAEVLRRGMRSLAREHGTSPMLRLLDSLEVTGWPSGTAAAHDSALADAYLGSNVVKGRS